MRSNEHYTARGNACIGLSTSNTDIVTSRAWLGRVAICDANKRLVTVTLSNPKTIDYSIIAVVRPSL